MQLGEFGEFFFYLFDFTLPALIFVLLFAQFPQLYLGFVSRFQAFDNINAQVLV